MEDLLFSSPVFWISKYICPPSQILYEAMRRRPEEKWCTVIEHINRNMRVPTPTHRTDYWGLELFYTRELHHSWFWTRIDDINMPLYDLFSRILCQALAVPRDCVRSLADTQQHNFLFFTNHRTIQVYCFHNANERAALEYLVNADIYFRWITSPGGKLDNKNYHQHTIDQFTKTRPLLAWECIYPEGIDMEALSPRDANAHIRVKQSVPKSKTLSAKQTQKEKDHPPPPPQEVQEPPSYDRKNGAIYRVGKLLGKGGFAICYEGRQSGTKQLYALKIVRSHMPQKTMEQKFQTELQIHSKMKHANIVQFHRAFSYQKCTYIVLELCPNGSLMDVVKKRKYITEPEVRFWTVQMAGAIKYMHAKGIIHRDLKMGNIFLDKDMNVKIGDFGLAALLMSGKDWNACRRTTLCGTPNYIAPEIVSKDKAGHDHAVDIWSLGIIIFALLTGKPPFQSATADEIYRRARERDYDWPKLNTSENFISQETKDLVAELLQAAEKRPNPDVIVQHPFFVCGWMPQSEEMTPDLRETQPAPDQFLSVGIRGGRSNLYTRNLKKLCIKCEVGPWSPESKEYTSTYREVAAEEKAGLTPAVPLPENVVYRPFDDWLRDQAREVVEDAKLPSSAESALNKVLEPLPQSKTKEPLPSIKPVAQSFAAQQRSRLQGYVAGSSVRAGKGRETAVENNSRPMINIPTRHAKAGSYKSEHKAPEQPEDVEDRLAADLAKQLEKAEQERKSIENAASTASRETIATFFHPRESLETLPKTKPDQILDGLRRLQKELERALNSRSVAAETRSPPSSPAIVVKWVDYTNKFGLGYILSNGSVGCIFRSSPASSLDPSQGYLPPSCIVVRDAETHLQLRNNKAYPDRHQLVPIRGANIEFYENRGEKGICRGKVNPSNFRVPIGKDGHVGKLSRGVDEWDDRKREKIVLWKKFANYMTVHGRDQDYPFDDALARIATAQHEETVPAGNVVTFYQRFGDVGCWSFYDGHFQFNFPDHTKIIISADGTWCDFYHLPIEAARDLSSKGTLASSALDDRQHLSYPLQTLLNFMSKPSKASKATTRKFPDINPMIQGIPHANDFRRKVEFVRLIIMEWVSNGGMGISDMTPEGRLKWNGYRELVNVSVPYKHVWVTVGARNGDARHVAWFDPRKPEEPIQDIE